jgi:hypothetical protein
VIGAAAHVVFFALAAAASPLMLTATFVAIRSARPRANGVAFLTGVLLGTTIASGLGLALGQALVARLDSHETVEAVLALLLGILLLAVGLLARRETPRAAPKGGRASAILTGLANVQPAAAFSMAGLLGFGGPKRLVLTFLAMTAISGAGVGDVESGALVVLFVVVSTVLVSVPVGIVIVAGERAAVILARGQSLLTTHAAALRVWLSIGIGAALVVDGLVRLLA